MDLLREVTEEYTEDLIPIVEAISTAVKELNLMKNGGKLNNKQVRDFIRKNASLVNASALNALAAHKQYKTNTRNTVSLFAKSAYDKRMITKLVKTLTDSKMFKLHRTKYAEGGKFWELKKVKSGF